MSLSCYSAFSYLYDHLGNTRVVYTASFNCATPTTQTRTLELMSDYYPFGKVLRSFDPAPADEKYLMTQKERDSETGLDYFGARYYDSDVCRWLSVDPLGTERPGLSSYNYVQNNPLLLVDPDGALDDNYYILKSGTIMVEKTSDNFDNFYIESGKDNDGFSTYSFEIQLSKNTNGLLAIPASFSSKGYGFTYSGSKTENYISGSAFAALLGAINEVQFTDISLNHWSNADGTSPKPSRSHKNGQVGDIRPLRHDQSGAPVTVADSQFDAPRNAALVRALNKYGWTSILSERNPSTGYITPKSKHYTGSYDKYGNWKSSRHNDHFHIQKFQPNLVPYVVPKPIGSAPIIKVPADIMGI